MAENVKEAGNKTRPGGYSFAKQQARRDKRREAAEARQAEYDKLTTKQKLERAKARGGSKKEIAKLEARLEAEKKAKTAQPPKVESPKVETPKTTESTEKKHRSKYQKKQAQKAS